MAKNYVSRNRRGWSFKVLEEMEHTNAGEEKCQRLMISRRNLKDAADYYDMLIEEMR